MLYARRFDTAQLSGSNVDKPMSNSVSWPRASPRAQAFRCESFLLRLSVGKRRYRVPLQRFREPVPRIRAGKLTTEKLDNFEKQIRFSYRNIIQKRT